MQRIFKMYLQYLLCFKTINLKFTPVLAGSDTQTFPRPQQEMLHHASILHYQGKNAIYVIVKWIRQWKIGFSG